MSEFLTRHSKASRWKIDCGSGQVWPPWGGHDWNDKLDMLPPTVRRQLDTCAGNEIRRVRWMAENGQVLQGSGNFARKILRAAPKKVLDEMKAEGWTIDATGGGHVKWMHPNGAIVYSASTPSDRRAWDNHLSQMRRSKNMKPPLRGALGGTRKADLSWDVVTTISAALGCYIGKKYYDKPVLGAALGAASPILIHWVVDAVRRPEVAGG